MVYGAAENLLPRADCLICMEGVCKQSERQKWKQRMFTFKIKVGPFWNMLASAIIQTFNLKENILHFQFEFPFLTFHCIAGLLVSVADKLATKTITSRFLQQHPL